MTPRKKAYSVNEFVSTSGLGKTYVYGLIKNGKLRAKKVGKRTIILDEDADNYLHNLPDFEVITGVDTA